MVSLFNRVSDCCLTLNEQCFSYGENKIHFDEMMMMLY